MPSSLVRSTTDPMASRVRSFGTTIFAEMSALAREHQAVNLGQGFPDFDGPESIRLAAVRAMEQGHNQYAVSHGEPELRRAIAEHAARFYGQIVDPDTEITVTSGATEAILCVPLGLIEPGDEVIVFEPTYDSYVPTITMAGGVPVPVTLRPPEFSIDPDELRAAISPKTRAIYINTPHNPTGRVFSNDELTLLAELCCEHDLIAIVDEVYEHIVYPGAKHQRLATFPGMHERTLTISSGGKTFSFTGWKIGWAIGPPHLQAAIRRAHQYTVFATSTPMQYAIAEALRLPDEYFTRLADDYRQRRDFLVDVLRATPLLPYVPEGSYFVLCDISRTGHTDANDFARWFIREVGVATIPPGSFYLNPNDGAHLIRFCFCKKWETLHLAAKRIERLPP